MISAREADVVGYRMKDGIMNVKFSHTRGPSFHYDPPTKDSFGDQPHERDPLDKKYIVTRAYTDRQYERMSAQAWREEQDAQK